MNLILFESTETAQPLSRKDSRAVHVLDVLRRGVGDSFDVGLINGPRGKATVRKISAEALELSFAWGPTPQPADPITLIVGMPRPQTARDILRDATTLGVAAIHFVRTEKSDPNYAASTLWSGREWRRHLIVGAEQAFDTRIPEVTHTFTLAAILEQQRENSSGIALDNYEAPSRFSELQLSSAAHYSLAIGGERGWSAADRALLRQHQFALAHLGARVLRTETATVVGLTLLRSKLRLI